MKLMYSLIAAVALAINLTGCIVVGGDDDHDWGNNDSWQEQQRDNRHIVNSLELQTSRASVIDRLGAPNFSEAFTLNDDEYRVLYYRTQHRHSDGETTKDETTPLVFKNNRLVGWGQETLDSIRH